MGIAPRLVAVVQPGRNVFLGLKAKRQGQLINDRNLVFLKILVLDKLALGAEYPFVLGVGLAPAEN